MIISLRYNILLICKKKVKKIENPYVNMNVTIGNEIGQG